MVARMYQAASGQVAHVVDEGLALLVWVGVCLAARIRVGERKARALATHTSPRLSRKERRYLQRMLGLRSGRADLEKTRKRASHEFSLQHPSSERIASGGALATLGFLIRGCYVHGFKRVGMVDCALSLITREGRQVEQRVNLFDLDDSELRRLAEWDGVGEFTMGTKKDLRSFIAALKERQRELESGLRSEAPAKLDPVADYERGRFREATTSLDDWRHDSVYDGPVDVGHDPVGHPREAAGQLVPTSKWARAMGLLPVVRLGAVSFVRITQVNGRPQIEEVGLPPKKKADGSYVWKPLPNGDFEKVYYTFKDVVTESPYFVEAALLWQLLHGTTAFRVVPLGVREDAEKGTQAPYGYRFHKSGFMLPARYLPGGQYGRPLTIFGRHNMTTMHPLACGHSEVRVLGHALRCRECGQELARNKVEAFVSLEKVADFVDFGEIVPKCATHIAVNIYGEMVSDVMQRMYLCMRQGWKESADGIWASLAEVTDVRDSVPTRTEQYLAARELKRACELWRNAMAHEPLPAPEWVAAHEPTAPAFVKLRRSEDEYEDVVETQESGGLF